jgi:hypothetical protein
MTQAAQFKQGGTSRGAGDDDDDDVERRPLAPCKILAQVGGASHHHHVPKVHDIPTHPHEIWNVMACGET